jgi:ABC-type polysaccharide/polyol phosphate export permease
MRIADHKYLNLWREMTRAQFKLRDQSSFFGFLWSFLNPLITVGLLFALFSAQLSNQIRYYGLYLLIGIVNYTYFSNATGASVNVLQSMNALTRNGVFPKEVLVLSSITTHTIDFIISTTLCVLIALVSGVGLNAAMLAIPLILILQLTLVLWVSLLLSSFFVYVRDLMHIYNVFLRLLFFITPIFYGLSFVGHGIGHFVLLANPLAHSIMFARTILIDGKLFDVKDFFFMFAINATLLVGSYRIFKRLEPTFAENV